MIVFVVALAATAFADCYMHNPRGSNNRWRTTTANDNNVQNNNRLFDSQDNDDGGYDVSFGTNPFNRAASEPMRYYEGSNLNVQWAAQHACGKDSWIHCEFVLQYKCGTHVWDGESNNDLTYTNDGNGAGDDVGLHESWHNHRRCRRRFRNKGLFIADRETTDNLNANEDRAIYTRQENDAERHGFECDEERDYYPYWAPSEWVDIAIITDNLERCDLYWKGTQNTNPKYTCVATADVEGPTGNGITPLPAGMPYITEQECTTAAQADQNNRGIAWVNPQENVHKSPWFSSRAANVAAGAAAQATIGANPEQRNRPFWGAHTFQRPDCQRIQSLVGSSYTQAEADEACAGMLNGPECLETTWMRDNHLGSIKGGFLANYTWKIPEHTNSNERCVLRIRYNMSSSDYDPWNTYSEANGMNSAVEQDPYEFYNWKSQPISLALNTNQYGRTFQDRSHSFKIIKRPSNLENQVIHNVNVVGKRGHVTQVYPSFTYDFTPKYLHINQGDYVHFQWEGSSTVRTGYGSYETNGQYFAGAGGGQDRTERHNIVQIKDMKSNYPLPLAEQTMFGSPTDQATVQRTIAFAMANQHIPLTDSSGASTGSCSPFATVLADAGYDASDPPNERWMSIMRARQDPNNCAALNRAPETFWSDPIPFLQSGNFYYMSTRDNFPGLQTTKGAIFVHPAK